MNPCCVRLLSSGLAVWLLAALPASALRGQNAGADAATTYEQWVNAVFDLGQQTDPSISGMGAAPAGDGVPNLVKYAFGLDPLRSATGHPRWFSSGFQDGRLTLGYTLRKAAADLIYAPQVSGDLAAWSEGPDTVAEIGRTDLDAAFARVSVADQTTPPAPARFGRVVVDHFHTAPPPAPGNLTAAWGEGGVHLSWTEQAGGDLLTYRLESSEDNGATWGEVATFSAGQTSYVTAPDLYTRTFYRLIAFNAAGASVPAATVDMPSGGTPQMQAFFAWTTARFSPAELAALNVSGTWMDPDNDGLPNFEEFLAGSDPHNPDTDNDNVLDGQDAVPTDPDFTFARVPIARYTIVGLARDFITPVAINNVGQVLAEDANGNPVLLAKGQTYPVPLYRPESTVDGLDYNQAVGLADDGTVLVNRQTTYIDEWGYGHRYDFAQTTRFDGTNFTSPQPLRSLSHSGAPIGDAYVVATAISKGGNILGSCYRDGTEEGGSDFFVRTTACVWLPPDYAPQRVPNLPDGNDRTLTFTDPDPITLYNSTGWDDSLAGAYAITDAGLVLTQTIENDSTDDASAVMYPDLAISYHGLLSPAPTQTPVDLGVKAIPTGVNDRLQLAVGSRYQDGTWETFAWIGKKGWQVKPLPMNNAESCTPSKINDAGQILAGGWNLWQNGRIYNINDQIGDPLEPVDPTSDICTVDWLSDLNDSGVMVGLATYQTRDAQGNPVGLGEERAVLLKPIRDGDENPAARLSSRSVDRSGFAAAAVTSAAKPPNPTPGVITVKSKTVRIGFSDYQLNDGDHITVTVDNANRHPDGSPNYVLYNAYIPPQLPPNLIPPQARGDLRYVPGAKVSLTHGLNTFTVKATSTGRAGPCTLRITIAGQETLNGQNWIERRDLAVGETTQFTLGFSQVHYTTAYPEANDHARIAQGSPTVKYARLVTISKDPQNVQQRRRRVAQSNYRARGSKNEDGSGYDEPVPGQQQLDEYPPVAFPEVEERSHVKPINGNDNMKSGGSIGGQIGGYDKDDVVELVVD